MTSGNFRSLEISSIIVLREERHRRDLVAIPELAASIKRNGLVHPVLVQRETLVLIAGERRLEACRSLGWTHINAQFEDEADPAELQILELEENIRRSDLTWQDNCLAIHQYHRSRLATEPGWTAAKTALALNMSAPDLSKKMSVAEEIVGGNTTVKAAPKLSTAVGITSRAKERAVEAALNPIKALHKAAEPEAAPESIIIADFNEWATTYIGPRFNLIHCDFPYGIGADKFKMGVGGGSTQVHGGYSDTFEDYSRLITSLGDNIDRLASDSAHIVFWFSMRHYQFTFETLSKTFDINPFPLIWLKSDGAGVCPDPQRGPFRIYETAFFGSRGDRKIVRAKHNGFAAPSVRDIHMSVKNPDMLEYFFAMFVDQNTRMLDPTCGSGSALRAAERLGAAYVIGLERNPEFALSARVELEKSRKARKAV